MMVMIEREAAMVMTIIAKQRWCCEKWH